MRKTLAKREQGENSNITMYLFDSDAILADLVLILVPLGCLGTSPGDLWELLGRPWVPLGASLGRPWALLGDSGGPLGIMWAGLGLLWEPSETPGVNSGWIRMCGGMDFLNDFLRFQPIIPSIYPTYPPYYYVIYNIIYTGMIRSHDT